MIAHLPEKDVSSLHLKAPEVSEYIATNLPQILALGIDFEPSRLAFIPFELEDITSIGGYPAMARQLAEEGRYKLSSANVEFVFREVYGFTAISDLRVKHYTTILRTKNLALIEKVQSDFDLYLKNILLQSKTNTEEEVETIIEVIVHDEIDGKSLEDFIANQSAKLPSFDQVPVRLYSMILNHRKMVASWDNCIGYLASESFDPATLTAYLDHEDSLSILSSATVSDQDYALPLRQFVLNNNEFKDSAYRTYIQALPKQFKQFPSEVDLEKLQILIEEQKITFSESSFTFLEGKESLQVLYVANNIDRFLTEKANFSLDDDFREELLKSKVSDTKKLEIMADMDLTSLSNLPDRASIVGQLFHRTGASVDDLSSSVAQSLVIHSTPITTQISLFNRCQRSMSDQEILATLNKLPKPFSEIEPGWNRPTIPSTPENLELAKWLEARTIISSSKPGFFSDEIRIHNRRKKG
jgi:hypothetical protein